MIASKRDFAVHFGTSPFKSEPLGSPLIVAGLLVPIVLLLLVLLSYSPEVVLMAAVTPPQVVEKIEELQRDWKAFKEANDQRLSGKADLATIDEKLATIDGNVVDLNAQVEAHEKRADKAERRLNHLTLNGGQSQEQTRFQKERELFGRILRDRKGVKEVDAELLRDYQRDFSAYLRKGDSALDPSRYADMMVGEDPQGGYWVEPSVTGRIVEFVEESTPMREIANVITVGSDEATGDYDLDETDANWVGETETRNDTDTPELGEWKIPVHELAAQPRATRKLLDDASRDVEGWLAEKVGSKFSRLQNTAFVVGSGVAQPRGFLDHTSGTPARTSVVNYRKVEQTNTGAAGAFASTDPGDVFYTCLGILKGQFRANARWLMARATQATALKLKDGDGNYLWQPSFQAGQPSLLIGFPMTLAEDMPAIAADSLSIAFGDFRAGYLIVDRQGISTLRDPYTAKPYIRFYSIARVGGDVVNFEAIKVIKFAA